MNYRVWWGRGLNHWPWQEPACNCFFFLDRHQPFASTNHLWSVVTFVGIVSGAVRPFFNIWYIHQRYIYVSLLKSTGIPAWWLSRFHLLTLRSTPSITSLRTSQLARWHHKALLRTYPWKQLAGPDRSTTRSIIWYCVLYKRHHPDCNTPFYMDVVQYTHTYVYIYDYMFALTRPLYNWNIYLP